MRPAQLRFRRRKRATTSGPIVADTNGNAFCVDRGAQRRVARPISNRPHVGQERERNNESNQDPVRFASGLHRPAASHARSVRRSTAAAPRPAGRRRGARDHRAAATACRSTSAATCARLLLGERPLALGWRDIHLGAGSLGRAASDRGVRSRALVERRWRLGVSSRWLEAIAHTAARGCRDQRSDRAAAAARRADSTCSRSCVLLDRRSLALGTRSTRVDTRALGRNAARLSLGWRALGRSRRRLDVRRGVMAPELEDCHDQIGSGLVIPRSAGDEDLCRSRR